MSAWESAWVSEWVHAWNKSEYVSQCTSKLFCAWASSCANHGQTFDLYIRPFFTMGMIWYCVFCVFDSYIMPNISSCFTVNHKWWYHIIYTCCNLWSDSILVDINMQNQRHYCDGNILNAKSKRRIISSISAAILK